MELDTFKVIRSLLTWSALMRSRCTELADHGLEDLWHDLGSVAEEEPVAFAPAISRDIVLVHVDDRDLSTAHTGLVDVASSRVDPGGSTDDEDQIDLLGGVEVGVDFVEDRERKLLTEPDDTGTKDVLVALWARWEILRLEVWERDVDAADVEVFAFAARLVARGISARCRDGESRTDWIGEVLAYVPATSLVGAR